MSKILKAVRNPVSQTAQQEDSSDFSEILSRKQELLDRLYLHLDDQESLIESMENFIDMNHLREDYKAFVKQSIRMSRGNPFSLVK